MNIMLPPTGKLQSFDECLDMSWSSKDGQLGISLFAISLFSIHPRITDPLDYMLFQTGIISASFSQRSLGSESSY